MSWDIFISKSPVSELEQADFKTIGTKEEVIYGITRLLPTSNFEDPCWGNFREDNCSIEFSLDDTPTINHLVLHVRGDDNVVIMIIQKICEAFDCYAMDGSTGEQMSFDENDQASFEEWQAYRNKVIAKNSQENS